MESMLGKWILLDLFWIYPDYQYRRTVTNKQVDGTSANEQWRLKQTVHIQLVLKVLTNLHILLYILSVEVTKGVAGDGGWEETRTQSTGNEIQSTGSSEREQLILARRA